MAQPELTYPPEIQNFQRLNITNMLNDEAFNDVTFVIGKEEKEFKAHRAFLAAISPVFKATSS